jgi:hypothetical protein
MLAAEDRYIAAQDKLRVDCWDDVVELADSVAGVGIGAGRNMS